MRFQQYLKEGKKKKKKKEHMSQGELLAKARVPTVGHMRKKEVSKKDRVKKEKKKEKNKLKKMLKQHY